MTRSSHWRSSGLKRRIPRAYRWGDKKNIQLRSGIESAHVYRQMLQRGIERFRPFRQGVHHSGACIFERDAVELSELTNNPSLFLGEASLDAKSVETWL